MFMTPAFHGVHLGTPKWLWRGRAQVAGASSTYSLLPDGGVKTGCSQHLGQGPLHRREMGRNDVFLKLQENSFPTFVYSGSCAERQQPS